MTRGKFLALLGLVPVAIKAAVTKSVEPKPNLGHWMSDGTGSSSFDPINYQGEFRWNTEPLTFEKLDAIYTQMREDAHKQYVTPDLSHLFRP